jgi:hypothetical protein
VAQALPFPLFDYELVNTRTPDEVGANPIGNEAIAGALNEMSQGGWSFAAVLPDGRILMHRPRHVAVIMFEIPVIPVSGVLHRAG